MLFIRKLLDLLSACFGANNGGDRRGPGNVKGDQSVLRLGKSESAALDCWTDGMGNLGVTKHVVEVGAVHNKVLPPDGTGRAPAIVGSSLRQRHCKPESRFS